MKGTTLLGVLVFFLHIFVLSPFSLAEAGFLKRPLSFHQITTKDGLSSEMISAVAVQGEEVWFGTYAGGATLYDRSKNFFKTYTTKGEPQEKDDGVSIKWKNHPAYNHVSVILPDRDRLWFGTYFYGFGGGGISYYNPKKKNPWRPFTTNKDLAKKIVALAVDGDILWVGSEKGLSALDKKTEKWKSFYSAKDGLAGRNRAHHRDIGHNAARRRGRLGRIPARQAHAKALRQAEHAFHKLIDPALRQLRRQGE